MSESSPRVVTVLGAGTVGASLASVYAAAGCTVRIVDSDDRCLRRVETLAARVVRITASNQTPSDLMARMERHRELESACRNTEFVSESLPENLDLKRASLEQLEEYVGPRVIIATSTSSLLVSDLQRGLRHPERVVAAHPFNPPHLVPLIEVAGGKDTADWALNWTMRFYRALGRVPIRLKREAIGHLANRLTAALYREAVDLVASGVASVADVDAAVRYGPGLRWAVMGPHMTYHLAGGEGGYAAYLEHLGPAQERRWASLRTPQLTPEVKLALVEGVAAEAESLGIGELEARRDAALIAILQTLRTMEPLGADPRES